MTLAAIRVQRIPITGSITADANGTISNTFHGKNEAINGEIVRITYDSTAMNAAGSIWLFESGTNLQISLKKGISGSVTVFPMQQIQDNTGASIGNGSGNIWYPFPINGQVWLAGSAVGNGSSFVAWIYYR